MFPDASFLIKVKRENQGGSQKQAEKNPDPSINTTPQEKSKEIVSSKKEVFEEDIENTIETIPKVHISWTP